MNEETGCHVWQGAKAGNGYGYVTIRQLKKNIYLHRFVYEQKYGVIQKGVCVMHKCDNPSCCNVAHLIAGSHSDNTRDMIKKGRHPAHMRKGTSNRKLTDKQVAMILIDCRSTRNIAPDFGVHHSVIQRLKLNGGY